MPFIFLTFLVDRNQTVSRRFKPTSRNALIGEQPNPWHILQRQDAWRRHRGAKLFRRYGLSEKISLLSLAYLLSVKQRLFLTTSLDHYNRLSTLFDPSVSQSSKLMLLHSSNHNYSPSLPLHTSDTLSEATAPVKLPP